eukprot:7215474-Prymnesium_polylepis.1
MHTRRTSLEARRSAGPVDCSFSDAKIGIFMTPAPCHQLGQESGRVPQEHQQGQRSQRSHGPGVGLARRFGRVQ